MPFTFRMILSGLMAVIPDRTFDTSLESADSVTILVPNLLKPRPLNNRRNGQQEILDPHFPILDFDLQNRQASSTRPVDLSTNDGRGICHLETEKIEILPLPGLAQDFKLLTGVPNDVDNPTPGEKRSLFWLVTMEQASPGNGALEPGLDAAPLNRKGRIITQVKLERGTLATHALSENSCRIEPLDQNPLDRRVAASLQLLIENVPIHVALSMKKEGKPAQTLFLAPPDGTSEVRVRLMSREFEHIGLPEPPEPDELDQPVADFEVFYDLVKGFDREQGIRPFLFEVVPPPPGRVNFTTDTPKALCPPTALRVVGSGSGS